MTFNEILRNLIEDADLTQKKIAKDLGIAPSTLGGYVQGTSEPDFETLKSLAKYFDVSTDYLLDIRSPNKTSHMEEEISRIYNSLDDKSQNLYIDLGKTILKNSKNSY